jgi:hypothetical protein
LTLPQSRLDAFEFPIKKALSGCLLKELQGVAEIFDSVRETLQGAEELLGEHRTWWESDGYELYSTCHAHLAAAFAFLADPDSVWAAVELQDSISSSPRPMGVVISEEEAKEKAEKEAKERAEEKEKDDDDDDEEEEEGLPCRVKHPASGRKRSHHEGEQADDDDGETRSSASKRVKSNNGGRVSASGPSGASTSAGGSTGYRLRSKGRN